MPKKIIALNLKQYDKKTPEVLANMIINTHIAQQVITAKYLSDIGHFIKDNLELLTFNTLNNPKQLEQWQNIYPCFMPIIDHFINNPYKIFEFLFMLADKLEYRSYKIPIPRSPFLAKEMNIPTVVKIIKEFIRKTTSPSKTNWAEWLENTFKKLNKTGARTLSGLGIHENKDEILSIPSSSWFAIEKGKYAKGSIRLHTTITDTIRQNSHTLNSIINYAQANEQHIEMLNKIYRFIESPKELDAEQRVIQVKILTEIFEYYENKHTWAQTQAKEKTENLKSNFMYVPAYKYQKLKPAFKTSVSIVQRYINKQLSINTKQVGRLRIRRATTANDLLLKLTKKLPERPDLDTIQNSIFLLEGIQSGFTQKETLITLEENNYLTNLNKIHIKLATLLTKVLSINRTEQLIKKIKENNHTFLNNIISNAIENLSWLNEYKKIQGNFSSVLYADSKSAFQVSTQYLISQLRKYLNYNFQPNELKQIQLAIDYLNHLIIKSNTYYAIKQEIKNRKAHPISTKQYLKYLENIITELANIKLNISLRNP
ncbi:MAG: hypothetical protein KKA19_06500 [Candidatus Margulisbacteria bacterium]|nr:hypothetical protein [Candidatus Margulisiibacteriota bacterium]